MMADPWPTSATMDIHLELKRALSEDELTCWFCHGPKVEWETTYQTNGTRHWVGIHESCRAKVLQRNYVKSVGELEETVTDLESRIIDQNVAIQAFQVKIANAESVIELALDSYYEADWTDLAYDVLGRTRRKSVGELEAENETLRTEIERLKRGSHSTSGL